jgi:hypothetical protein
LHEAEQRLIGPVELVEHEDEQLFALRERLEQRRGGLQRFVAATGALRLARRRSDAAAATAADRILQPGEREQPVGLGDEAERRDRPRRARPSRVGALPLLDLEPGADHLFDGERRRRGPVRQRAASEHADPLASEPARELFGEPALPHPCRAEDGRERRAAIAPNDPRKRLEHLQLFVAADQRRLEPVDVLAGQGALGDGLPHRERLGLALGDDRLMRAVLNGPGGREVGAFPDQHLARGPSGLDPLRRVHRVADDRVLIGAADDPGDDFPRVDPDPHAELHAAVALELMRVRGQVALHLERAPHRALGVVLVRLRSAEHSHYLVADDLVHAAAVQGDELCETLEGAIDDRLHLFGIEPLAHLGEAGQVREEDGDDPAFRARRFAERQTTRRAEARARGNPRAAARAGLGLYLRRHRSLS